MSHAILGTATQRCDAGAVAGMSYRADCSVALAPTPTAKVGPLLNSIRRIGA
jgi:hypothetical protein